jgi:hypothetical protein
LRTTARLLTFVLIEMPIWAGVRFALSFVCISQAASAEGLQEGDGRKALNVKCKP